MKGHERYHIFARLGLKQPRWAPGAHTAIQDAKKGNRYRAAPTAEGEAMRLRYALQKPRYDQPSSYRRGVSYLIGRRLSSSLKLGLSRTVALAGA